LSAAGLLFDSHCHLDDERFDADRDELISGLPFRGLYACLTCGSDLASSKASAVLAARYPFVYAATGIHPHEAAKEGAEDLAGIRELLHLGKVVALGEIGLDFHYDFSPRDMQLDMLAKQLDLAIEMNKPVVLHVLEAHGAMLDFLGTRPGRLPRGVLHCYSGSAESAAAYQALGFYISFAGPVTFKNAGKIHLALEAVAPDRLLIETDSPYLAPQPFRGKRNDPSMVAEICRKIAELRGTGEEIIARLSCENACALFGISPPGS
jgi:TatD DNase family protein